MKLMECHLGKNHLSVDRRNPHPVGVFFEAPFHMTDAFSIKMEDRTLRMK
jgi:hypothetical protein